MPRGCPGEGGNDNAWNWLIRKFSRVKDLVKLPKVSSGETCQEAQNHNVSLHEH